MDSLNILNYLCNLHNCTLSTHILFEFYNYNLVLIREYFWNIIFSRCLVYTFWYYTNIYIFPVKCSYQSRFNLSISNKIRIQSASPVAIYGAQRLLVYTLPINTILDYTVTYIVTVLMTTETLHKHTNG